MTKIVHPFAFRLGILRDWRSSWITGGKILGTDYKAKLKQDVLVREFLTKKLRNAFVHDITMDRSKGEWRIKIETARPGLIIGRSGEGVAELKKAVETFCKQKKIKNTDEVKLDIIELKNAESSARVVSMMVAEGLEKRLPFRRVMKSTIERVSQSKDVLGIKITLGGRLGGADMARVESLKKGNIPLQTLRADIDFYREKAHMTYGVIGIKVWIYKGNVFAKKTK